jgi:hypothetical protein
LPVRLLRVLLSLAHLKHRLTDLSVEMVRATRTKVLHRAILAIRLSNQALRMLSTSRTSRTSRMGVPRLDPMKAPSNDIVGRFVTP